MILESGDSSTGAAILAAGMARFRSLAPSPPEPSHDGSVLRAGILWIDRVLRRYYGVHEFSQREDDLLRIAIAVAEHRVVLADGTVVQPGDIVVDLHLWNERVRALGGGRALGLGWGCRAKRRIERSLAALAAHVEVTQGLAHCKAFRAEAVFIRGRRERALLRIAQRLGFGTPKNPERADVGHTLLAFALTWAFHPGDRAYRGIWGTRYTFWMSRRALRDRYFADLDTRASHHGSQAMVPPAALGVAEESR
jgi:hypothetical protein